MRTSPPALLPLFRSEMQVRLLAAVLIQYSREWTLNELADALAAPVSSVHRELDRAVSAGLVERDDSMRPHHYSAAIDSPFWVPMTRLLSMSVGVESELRDALEDLPIDAAVLHGSWVTGPLRPNSDIDVLVIGDVDLKDIRRRVRPIGKRAGRTIDVTVLGRGELAQMVRQRASFARHLQEHETAPLVGDLSTILET